MFKSSSVKVMGNCYYLFASGNKLLVVEVIAFLTPLMYTLLSMVLRMHIFTEMVNSFRKSLLVAGGTQPRYL